MEQVLSDQVPPKNALELYASRIARYLYIKYVLRSPEYGDLIQVEKRLIRMAASSLREQLLSRPDKIIGMGEEIRNQIIEEAHDYLDRLTIPEPIFDEVYEALEEFNMEDAIVDIN